MKLILFILLALVSLSSFAQQAPGDIIHGQTEGYLTFLTGPGLVWQKVDFSLEAEVLNYDELKKSITLTNIIVGSGWGDGHKVEVTSKAKKFICQAFDFNTIKRFTGVVSKKYVKIRSLDSYPTEEYDIVGNTGKIVFQTIECSFDEKIKLH